MLIKGTLSWTQTLPDFFPEDFPDDQDPDLRNSQDQDFVTQYGKTFIDLCKQVLLHILNGRFLGDLLGNYTCIKHNGMSVVDYAAVFPDILNHVKISRSVNFCQYLVTTPLYLL